MIMSIIIIFILVFLLLVISKSTSSYDKCYSDMEYSGIAAMGCCEGKTNGIGDLSETCTNCPHLVSLDDKEESKND